MEFSKNYGQIIIGYGLLSIGITLVMLFLQTAGIFWLILAVATIIVGIWIIKKERNEREKSEIARGPFYVHRGLYIYVCVCVSLHPM